jgi:hypothetical protein
VNPTEPDQHKNRPSLQRAWDAIPAAVRAILAGFVILMIGGSVSGVLMFANLKLMPDQTLANRKS